MPQTPKYTQGDLRSTLITVASYDDRIPRGTIFNSHCGEVAFCGVMELLSTVEQLLDELEAPRPAVNLRSFAEPPKRPALREACRPEPVRGSFVLRVIFRQNASWQGIVTHVEGSNEQNFRSVYELLHLIDGALGG